MVRRKNRRDPAQTVRDLCRIKQTITSYSVRGDRRSTFNLKTLRASPSQPPPFVLNFFSSRPNAHLGFLTLGTTGITYSVSTKRNVIPRLLVFIKDLSLPFSVPAPGLVPTFLSPYLRNYSHRFLSMLFFFFSPLLSSSYRIKFNVD